MSNGSTFAIPLCLNTSSDVVFVSVVIILNYFHIWQILHTFKLQIICTIGLKSFPKQSMLIPIQLLYSLISANCAHVELCVTLCLDTCALYTDAHRYTHTQTHKPTHTVQYVRSFHHVRTYSTYPPTGLSLTVVRPVSAVGTLADRRHLVPSRPLCAKPPRAAASIFSFLKHFVTASHSSDSVFSA